MARRGKKYKESVPFAFRMPVERRTNTTMTNKQRQEYGKKLDEIIRRGQQQEEFWQRVEAEAVPRLLREELTESDLAGKDEYLRIFENYLN